MKKFIVALLSLVLAFSATVALAKGGGSSGGGGGSRGGSFSGGRSIGSSSLGSSKSSISSSKPSIGSTSIASRSITSVSSRAPLPRSTFMPSRSVMPASRAGRALPAYVGASRSYRGAPVYYSHSDDSSSLMPFFMGYMIANSMNHNGQGAAGAQAAKFSGQAGDFGGGGASVNIDDFGSMVLSRRINDFANILTPAQEEGLNSKFAALENISSNQVVLVTVPSLEGKDIQQVAFDSAKLWKIGTEENNNGILIILAVKEKKARIEVGRGLEGAYPDLAAKHILEAAGPLFAEKKFNEGFNLIADDIFTKTKDEYNAQKTRLAIKEKKEAEDTETLESLAMWLVGIIAACIFLTVCYKMLCPAYR